MRIALIIAAAGSGTRFRENGACGSAFADCDKLWIGLDGEPLWMHSLRNLGQCVSGEIILSVHPGRKKDFERVIGSANLPWNIKIIAGGSSRVESVSNALNVLKNDDGFVAIHDAARPLADAELLESLCRFAADNYPAGVIPAAKAADTVKLIDAAGNVLGDVERSGIALVGTPQVFPVREYKKALAAALRSGSGKFTDDAGIYLAAGYKVKVLYSTKYNTKVTVPDDFACVKVLAAQK